MKIANLRHAVTDPFHLVWDARILFKNPATLRAQREEQRKIDQQCSADWAEEAADLLLAGHITSTRHTMNDIRNLKF